MHFHDPARPMINHRPCYIIPGARRLAALPDLSICPGAEFGMFEVRAAIIIEDGAFSFKYAMQNGSTSLPLGSVTTLLLEYQNDPEAALRAWFNWAGPTVAIERTLDLEDLGL